MRTKALLVVIFFIAASLEAGRSSPLLEEDRSVEIQARGANASGKWNDAESARLLGEMNPAQADRILNGSLEAGGHSDIDTMVQIIVIMAILAIIVVAVIVSTL